MNCKSDGIFCSGNSRFGRYSGLFFLFCALSFFYGSPAVSADEGPAGTVYQENSLTASDTPEEPEKPLTYTPPTSRIPDKPPSMEPRVPLPQRVRAPQKPVAVQVAPRPVPSEMETGPTTDSELEAPRQQVEMTKPPQLEEEAPARKVLPPPPAPETERPKTVRPAPRPSRSAMPPPAMPAANLFAEEFFMPPDLRLKYETTEVDGFVFLQTPNMQRNTNYSIVTGFGENVIKSRYVPGLKTPKDLQKWIDGNLDSVEFEGAEIRRLKFPSEEGEDKLLYWVGHQAYESADEARSQIALVKSVAESQGHDFGAMVSEASRALRLPDKPEPVEIKTDAQFRKEEAVALKWMDQLDLGERLFGPFQGVAPGEPVLWQSFGETTWRNTNLESKHFNQMVGFWTNRLVFKGIRFPINTLNPYLEITNTVEAVSEDFKSNMKLFAGLEWRPLERNAFLFNYRPWSIPLLIWMRNYRFYVQYGDRKNLKGEIANSDNHDLNWGVQIFYEWGIDLPALTEGGKPDNIPDFLRKYSWGEYFGNYRWEMTNFGSEDDFDAFIFNSSIILGVHLPGIPLPPNPINDEFALMPYMRFEHVSNTEFSAPFQNRYFVAAGIRWMPFRNYRYKESEWLSKFKIFAEYVGIGKVQHVKEHDGEAPHAVREDFRIGISISSRRF